MMEIFGSGGLRALWDRLLGRGGGDPGREREAAAFREFFADWLARHHPDLRLLAMLHPSHTVLRVDRQEVLIDAGGLFAWFRRSPEAVGRILSGFVEEVVAELRNREIPAFEDIVDRLHPQVRPFAFLEENSPRFGKGRLARLGLGAGLHLLFVIDEGRGMTFVNEGHLECWGVAEGALRNIALRNLAAGTAPVGGGPWRCAEPGGYAAARLLLLDRLHGLAPGAARIAAAPHRDLLVSLPAESDPRELEALALEAGRLWRSASRPLTPDLLHCRAAAGGGVEVAVAGEVPAPARR
jgi:hypothetical protein